MTCNSTLSGPVYPTWIIVYLCVLPPDTYRISLSSSDKLKMVKPHTDSMLKIILISFCEVAYVVQTVAQAYQERNKMNPEEKNPQGDSQPHLGLT